MPARGTGMLWKWQKGGSEEVSGSTSPWTQGLLVPSDPSSSSSLPSPALLLQLPRSLLAAAVKISFPPSPAALLLSIPCPWRVTKCHLFIFLFSCKVVLWEGSSTQPSLGLPWAQAHLAPSLAGQVSASSSRDTAVSSQPGQGHILNAGC